VIYTISDTLWNRALPSTPTNANTVDDIALFSLIAQATGFIRTRWAGCAMDDVQLSKLYYALSAMFNECIARI
jgi:hypothetical protein